MKGQLNYVMNYQGAQPNIQVVTQLMRNQSTQWILGGMYQTWIQFKQDSLSNSSVAAYNNYVCTMRFSSEKSMSPSDRYQDNSCGSTEFQTITLKKFNLITDQVCQSPWSPESEGTGFTTNDQT